MTPTRNGPTAQPSRRRLFVGAGLVAATCAVLIVAMRRGDDKPIDDQPRGQKPLQPGDVLLALDGIEITWGELADRVAWLDELAPEYSLQKKIQALLTDETITMRFARREFGAQREEQRQLAETFRASVGNVQELAKAGVHRTYRRAPLTRGDVTVPVARFVFEETNVGGVTPVTEVPRGYVVAGAFDLKQARAPMEDVVDVGILGFYTHDEGAWSGWTDQLRARIRTRVTYVHPDFRLAMPPWLVLP